MRRMIQSGIGTQDVSPSPRQLPHLLSAPSSSALNLPRHLGVGVITLVAFSTSSPPLRF